MCFFVFCACSPKVKEKVINDDLNLKVCACLETVKDIDSYNDEVKKALAVIFRTNIVNGNIKPENSSSSKFSDLVKQTSGEVLNVKDSKKIELDFVPENYTWKREIKKAELLAFLNKNNISLANLKNIEPEFDQNKNLIRLVIGGKNIDYFLLKNEFELESSKITNIEFSRENNSFVISGKGKDLEKFTLDLNEAQKLSKSGKNYKWLLNYFFSGFDIKTI